MKKDFLFSLLTIMLMQSCIYTRMTHMDTNDLAWMEVYNVGDTLLFHSSTCVDTMIVQEIDVYNSRNPFYISEADDEYTANASIIYEVRHHGLSLKGFCIIKKEYEHEPCCITLTLHNRYARCLKQDFQPFTINKEQLNDCMVINEANSKKSEFPVIKEMLISRFVWSKSVGLVEYEMIDGDTLMSFQLEKL